MKDSVIEIYVNKFNYIKSIEDADVNFIPPLIRRRLSQLDKCTISILNKTFFEDTQNIIFSSQYGEVERLFKIIEQYSEDKEVSPNTFSGSVHNYPIGFFLLNKKKAIPYTALSAGNTSISTGLLTAAISDYNNILFCYSDVINDNFFALCTHLTKTPSPMSKKYQIILQEDIETPDNFDDFVEIFNDNKRSIRTAKYKLERISNET